MRQINTYVPVYKNQSLHLLKMPIIICKKQSCSKYTCTNPPSQWVEVPTDYRIYYHFFRKTCMTIYVYMIMYLLEQIFDRKIRIRIFLWQNKKSFEGFLNHLNIEKMFWVEHTYNSIKARTSLFISTQTRSIVL